VFDFLKSDLGIFALLAALLATLIALVFLIVRSRVSGGNTAIASRNIMDKAVTEREEQLQAAISAMGAAIWDWDVASDLVSTGPRFSQIFGLDPSSQKPTMSLHNELCHPEDLPRVLEAFRNHVTTGKPYDAEYRIRHSAGHYIWVHSRGRVVSYDGEKPTRVIGTMVDVTDRRAAIEALRQSRESLELAVEAAEAGYFDIDETTSDVFWSAHASAIFGIDDASFVPNRRTFANFIHEDDLPEYLAEYEAFHIRGTPLNVIVRALHSNGHIIWLNVRMAGQFDADGRRVRTIGFFRDVSEQRHAQQVVADSELKYRSLIEQSIQGIVVHRRFKPLFCNHVYAQLLGYDNISQVLSLDSILAHDPKAPEGGAERHWEQSLSGELDGVVIEREIANTDGTERWLESVGRIIDWEGGPAVQLICVDVTDRKRTERELRDSEARFRLLADNVSDFITLYDEGLVYRYLSPSVERVTGFKPEDLLGRSIFEFNETIEFSGKVAEAHKRAALETTGQVLWQMRRKDGVVIWVETNNSIVSSPFGAVGRTIVSSSRDVTDRVEREAELSAARDRLKQQADELGVFAQSLEIARERAEQANAAKSQFLAMMSHELRTPMTGVLGMADLLMLSELNEEQEELTRVLTRSARSLLSVLNDILDFSKIEAGQLLIEATPFSISDIVEDTIGLFSPSASSKGVVIKNELPENFQDYVIGDSNRLRQVLSNLIGNAVKFTEQGKIVVNHAQENLNGSGLKLTFSVIDTGIGMTKEEAARVFQPFVQADISTSRKFGGSGLGLAICRRLVEAMGGSIDIRGKPGVGTDVTFSVVVAPDNDAAPRVKRHLSGAYEDRSMNESGPATACSVLIAEDNETNRFLISAMLKRMGHKVDAVENGALAVKSMQNKNYDIVLMDMQMPVMDGSDATKQIRKLPDSRSNIPIIALTADIAVDHRQMYFDAGVSAIVGKPVDWVILEHEINRQLSSGNKSFPESRARNGTGVNDSESQFEALDLDSAALLVLEDSIGADLLSEMLVSFLDNMLKYRADLDTALSEGNLKNAKRTAHALKGLTAQFGAPRVSNLAKFAELEAGTIDEIQKIMPDLVEAISAAEQALAERKNGASTDRPKA
jgi:PAS domain S-box-containing protein